MAVETYQPTVTEEVVASIILPEYAVHRLVEKLKRRSAVATTEESNEQKEQVKLKGLNKQALDPQKHEIIGNIAKTLLKKNAFAYTFQALLLDGTIDMLRKRAADDIPKSAV